jgi:hypothetical protein
METLEALKLKPEELTEFVKKTLETRPLSKSSLVEFAQGPRYYIEYLLGLKKDKEEWDLGKAVECLLLECEYDGEKWIKDVFDKKFIVADRLDQRKPENKKEWENNLANAKLNKQTLISTSMNSQAELMAIVTLSNPNCKYWIDQKKDIQKKISWTDKKTGLPITGIIDFSAEPDEHLTIIDIKTSKAESQDAFFKEVYKLGYNYQTGSYLTGYHKKYYKFPDFMFMVITKTFPYDSYMVHVPGDLCKDAKDEFDHLLTAFKYCMDNNQFHMGADFWLFDTLPYFSLEKPRYIKSKFINK